MIQFGFSASATGAWFTVKSCIKLESPLADTDALATGKLRLRMRWYESFVKAVGALLTKALNLANG